jgi:hypothetical protein
MPLLQAQHVTVSINRAFDEVNDFLSQPANFELWAAGLGKGFRHVSGSNWVFETPDGITKVRFTPKNDYGVADHYVSPSTDVEIYVPLRAVANGDGCEVTLTLFRQPDMTDDQFAADLAAVRRDMDSLKTILEA